MSIIYPDLRLDYKVATLPLKKLSTLCVVEVELADQNKLSDDSGTIRRYRQTHRTGRREAANGFPQSRCKSSHKEEATRKPVKSLIMSYLRALLEYKTMGTCVITDRRPAPESITKSLRISDRFRLFGGGILRRLFLRVSLAK
jgi:hypothetical protein